MKKYLSILLILCILVGVSHANLVYDETTNSYINTNPTAQSSVGSSTTSSNTSTASDTPVTVETTASENSEETEEVGEQISSIGSSEASTTSQVTTTSASDRDGTLQYMHEQTDSHHATLQSLLTKNYKALLSDSEALSNSDDDRLSVLQCLGIVNNDFAYIEDIKKTYTELQNEITLVTTDLHSEITGLESKIDQALLSTLNKNLQVGSLQNKIDAYNAEYTNVVDMYYELSLDEVANADELIQEGNDEYKDVVAVYDERVEMYVSLEEAYTNFLEKSSIAGGVTGPNIQQLTEVLDTLQVYYMSQYTEKWEKAVLSHIPANNKAFIEEVREQSRNAFAAYFNAEADSLLYGLYPVESLQNINKGVLTVRSAYLYDNASYDCKAFVENNDIETSAPALEKDMDELLEELAIAAKNLVGSGDLPRNADELAELLINKVKEQGFEDIDALISQESARIEKKAKLEGISWVQFGVTSSKTKWKSVVRTFLQTNYKKALEQDRIASFNAKLSRAYKKVVAALAKSPTGQTLDMLEAIGEVIEEFM